MMTDSGYAKSGNKNAMPTYKKNGEEDYSGSTAYWIARLKDALTNTENDELRKEILQEIDKRLD